MPPELIVPILAVITIAVIVAIGYGIHQHNKKRRLLLAALATEHSWAFEPGADADIPARFAHFELFRRGESRYGFNTMTGQMRCGERDWALVAGDYHYTVKHRLRSERDDTDYNLSYLILVSPLEAMPALAVRQEGTLDRLTQSIGFDDIDFESEEFSNLFCVQGPDKRFAYDVLHPRMMAWLLETPPPAFELARGQLCVKSTRRWTPLEYRHWLSWARDFLALWPEHVFRALEERRSA